MNKFSILTASYNSSIYLDEWKNSILDQSYRPLEVVFVNDFSEDNTADFISSCKDDFKNRDIELNIINNEQRLYCGSSYKKALFCSTGSFFGILDSDDRLENNACSIIMKYYNQYPEICWIYTQHFFCNIKSKVKKNGISSYPSHKNLLESGLKGQHCFSHWRTFSKRINNMDGIFKEGLTCAVDKYMGYKLEERGVGAFLNIPLYYYRYGNRDSIVKTEPTIPIWKNMMKECLHYRKMNRITVFPIRVL